MVDSSSTSSTISWWMSPAHNLIISVTVTVETILLIFYYIVSLTTTLSCGCSNAITKVWNVLKFLCYASIATVQHNPLHIIDLLFIANIASLGHWFWISPSFLIFNCDKNKTKKFKAKYSNDLTQKVLGILQTVKYICTLIKKYTVKVCTWLLP